MPLKEAATRNLQTEYAALYFDMSLQYLTSSIGGTNHMLLHKLTLHGNIGHPSCASFSNFTMPWACLIHFPLRRRHTHQNAFHSQKIQMRCLSQRLRRRFSMTRHISEGTYPEKYPASGTCQPTVSAHYTVYIIDIPTEYTIVSLGMCNDNGLFSRGNLLHEHADGTI